MDHKGRDVKATKEFMTWTPDLANPAKKSRAKSDSKANDKKAKSKLNDPNEEKSRSLRTDTPSLRADT